MNINITELINGSKDKLEIDNSISFDEDMCKRAGIISLNNVSLVGSIYVDSVDLYHIDIDVNGVMVLPCSITLKPVDYEFSFKIKEEYEEGEISNMTNDKNFKNTIDILPIIWENIVLEIPLKVLSSDAYDAKLEGDGWKLITDNNQEGEE